MRERGREGGREYSTDSSRVIYLPLLIIVIQNASTSLRVKDKVIEDHSNTIQKLKEVCIYG